MLAQWERWEIVKYWPRHSTWKPKRFGLVWWEKRVSSRAHGAQTIDKFRDPQRHRARTLPYIGSCHDHQSRPRPPLTSGTRRITRRGNNPVAVRRAVAARLVGPRAGVRFILRRFFFSFFFSQFYERRHTHKYHCTCTDRECFFFLKKMHCLVRTRLGTRSINQKRPPVASTTPTETR